MKRRISLPGGSSSSRDRGNGRGSAKRRPLLRGGHANVFGHTYLPDRQGSLHREHPPREGPRRESPLRV